MTSYTILHTAVFKLDVKSVTDSFSNFHSSLYFFRINNISFFLLIFFLPFSQLFLYFLTVSFPDTILSLSLLSHHLLFILYIPHLFFFFSFFFTLFFYFPWSFLPSFSSFFVFSLLPLSRYSMSFLFLSFTLLFKGTLLLTFSVDNVNMSHTSLRFVTDGSVSKSTRLHRRAGTQERKDFFFFHKWH